MKDAIIELYEKLQKDIEFNPLWIKKTKISMFAGEIVELFNLHGVIVPVCPECKSDDYDNIRGICNEEGCILCD